MIPPTGAACAMPPEQWHSLPGPAWHGRRGGARQAGHPRARTKLAGVPEPSRTLRAAAAAALALTLAGGVAGCAKFDAALGQQWATVSFKPNTSVATLLKVRSACSHIPNVHAEALPKKRTPETMMYSLTYRTDHASTPTWRSCSSACRSTSSVQGITFQDSGDSG